MHQDRNFIEQIEKETENYKVNIEKLKTLENLPITRKNAAKKIMQKNVSLI